MEMLDGLTLPAHPLQQTLKGLGQLGHLGPSLTYEVSNGTE